MMRKTKRRYRIAYTPFIVCWTRVPDTLGALWKQRNSWHRHVLECMTIHRGLFMSPWTGTLGWLAFPYLVIGEWLSPFMVAFGFIFGVVAAYFGFLAYYSQVVLLGLVFAMGLAICMSAVLLDELLFNTYSVRDLSCSCCPPFANFWISPIRHTGELLGAVGMARRQGFAR